MAAGLVAAGIAVGSAMGQEEPAPEKAEPVAAAVDASPVGDPVRLVVDKIGLDTAFEPLGLDDEGTPLAPEATDHVGWLVGGPEPGEPGTAVVAGHYDSRTGPAVFYRLDELVPGDEVVVGGEQGMVVFVVDRVESHPKNQLPPDVYAPTPGASLRLMTCGGEFDQETRHYRDNVIVWASLRPV